jgi:hypothetical protein
MLIEQQESISIRITKRWLEFYLEVTVSISSIRKLESSLAALGSLTPTFDPNIATSLFHQPQALSTGAPAPTPCTSFQATWSMAMSVKGVQWSDRV